MFFLSLTFDRLERLKKKENFIEIDASSFGPRVMTVFADGNGSRLYRTEHLLSLKTSPGHFLGIEEGAGSSHAICHWDSSQVDLFRDTDSGYPIYYFISDRGELFCSTHIRMFLQAGLVIEEDSALIPGLFVFCYVTPPKTMFKNIFQVSLGGTTFIDITPDGCKVSDKKNRISSIGQEKNATLSPEKATEKTLEILRHGVSPFAPLGQDSAVLLSGGLDSSILFQIAKGFGETGTTYSTGYPFEEETANREKEYAESAAGMLGANHRYYVPSKSEYLHGFLEAVAAVEAPVHLQTVLLYLLFKNGLSPDCRVLVCGEGADILYGTETLEKAHDAFSDSFTRRLLARSPLFELVRILYRITGRGYSLLMALREHRSVTLPLHHAEHFIWAVFRVGDRKWVHRKWGTSHSELISNLFDVVKNIPESEIGDFISHSLLPTHSADVTGQWSKAAEANGRTISYPFLTVSSIEHALSIPWPVKLESRKRILRDAARKLNVPDEIIEREKAAFAIRADRWAVQGGVFEPLVPLAAKVFPEAEIRAVQRPREATGRIFWNMLNFAVCKRLFVLGEPLETLQEELDKALAKC